MKRILRSCTILMAISVPLAPASAERLFGLTSGGAIVTFDSTAPSVVTSSAPITGLAAGDTLLGLDLRPATRTLYSIGTSGNVYSIVRSGGSYVATSVGVTAPVPNGSSFGIDFNPVPDRIRLVSDTNQNLRINPMTGAAIVDGAVTLDGSSNVDLVGAAYTNSRPGATTTVLYGLDALSDSLVRSTVPNSGTYVTTNLSGTAFGPLGLSFTNASNISFDISGGTGAAFLALENSLYALDLVTGSASLIGDVGAGTLVGLTAGSVPEPAAWALMIGGFGLVGAAMRRRETLATA